MNTFAIKGKRFSPTIRRSRLSRFGYRRPEVKDQQEQIHHILRSTGAQTKLTVGQPNDKYEQEADRVADQVMAMPDPKLQRQPDNEEEEETVQTKPLADQITPLIQRQAEPEEKEDENEKELKTKVKKLVEDKFGGDYKKAFNHYDRNNDEGIDAKELEELLDDADVGNPFTRGTWVERIMERMDKNKNGKIEWPEFQAVIEKSKKKEKSVQPKLEKNHEYFVQRQPKEESSLESRIHSLKGRGEPLPETTRSFFEPRFGYDFSDVRVHKDSQAAEMAQSIGARAFTVGQDVVLGSRQYTPENKKGRRLFAHELTHVVQQNGRTDSFPAGEKFESVPSSIQRKVKYISQVTGEEAKPFFAKFDKSVNKIASLIKGQAGPEAADLHQALAMLKDLRANGKVTLWNTSGGLHYASYHNGTGEIRLHVVHGVMATASGTLVHEAIHALHAVRFPRLAKMYAKVLAAGGTTNRNPGILLLKFKAWTEYWAYRKAAVYENLRQEPEFFTDPHKSAMSKKGVTGSISLVSKETGKPFEPWRWDPPAKYKAVKK